jgi:hypothetical protein
MGTMTADRVSNRAQPASAHIFAGIVVILIGVGWLATEVQALDVDWWRSWWGVVLFGIGLVRLAFPADDNAPRASRRMAAWLMSVGAWGFVSGAGLFGLHYRNSWPLLIIAAGVNIVWGALWPDRACREEDSDAR